MKRGRPLQDFSDEERKAANAAKMRARKKQAVINDNLFWNELDGVKVDQYKKVHKDKDHMNALMNMKISNTPTKKEYNGAEEAKTQIQNAYKNLKKGFTISFNDKAEEYLKDHFGRLMDKFLKSINYSDQWVAVYQFQGDQFRLKPIDEETKDNLYAQLRDEGFMDNMRETIDYIDPFESGGSFIPYQFDTINSIKFVNLRLNKINGDELGGTIKRSTTKMRSILAHVLAGELNEDVINRLNKTILRTTKNKKNEGRFWPYTLTIPNINLERQMIFNCINERTAKLIDRDNCLIYACKMAGMDEDLLDYMRGIIMIRSFSVERLHKIASETNIRFIVSYENGRTLTIESKNEDEKKELRLLLYKEHYMINEKVPVSQYFIRHRDEIMKSKQTRFWSIEEKMNTKGRNADGAYVKGTKKDHKLLSILKAIFDVNGFKEIRYGDYMTYSSSLYKSNLFSLSKLNYEPKYCCKLKAPIRSQCDDTLRVLCEADDIPL